jgi:beta-galactosidase
VYAEAARTAGELKRIGPRLANFRPAARVAILASLDSFHGIQFMPFDDQVNYMTVLNQMYGALYRLNTGVDFVFPEQDCWSDYRVLLVPPLYVASDDLLKRIAAFVENGGHAVMAFKSGFANEHSTVRWEMAPGPLRRAAGFRYQEFSTLAEPVALKGDPFGAGDANRVSVWAEMLIPESATPLAIYDHHFFGRYPAITQNRFGGGALTYEGTYLSDALQEKVIARVIEEAGLAGPERKLPAGVRLKTGTASSGKTMRFYLNYSREPQSFEYAYAGGQELLSGKPVAGNERLKLGPWDLAVIEEK